MSRQIPIRALLLGVLLSVVILAGPVSGTALATDTGAADTVPDDNQTEFTVTQGEECYQVTPIGHAWETVSDFYDYRSRESHGTAEFQENQVSNIFIHHGTEGYSLVVLHDKHGEFGNSPYGSTVTMEFVGLPEDGEWVVEDDTYEGQDDEFIHRGTRSKINWMWIGNRSDGAAFRGLDTTDNLDLTVTPRFNEKAEHWGDWDWSGDDTNRTETWRLFTERDETVALDMNESISITTDKCDSEAPSAALSASSTDIGVAENITLDASEATDNNDIVEYYWDLDGDGELDRTTTDPSVTHRYDEPGEYLASVVVRDSANNTDQASMTIGVRNESGTGSDGTGSGESDTDGGDGASEEQTTTTTSSDGPGLGLLVGFVAVLLSIAVRQLKSS